jgi:hypothetical protein
MNHTQQQIREILNSADQLLRGVIAAVRRIVDTPTRDWTFESRRHAMVGLNQAAGEAAQIFGTWMERNVWIKDVGRICRLLESIKSEAWIASMGDSRFRGRNSLRHDLERLINALGNGCECEMTIQTPDDKSLRSSHDSVRRDIPSPSERIDSKNRPYTIRELAVLQNLSYQTIVRLYENEPGILVLQGSPEHQRKLKRRHRTIRVPHHVYLRVKHRLENR